MSESRYEPLNHKFHYIDRSERLEVLLERSPVLYIEGAAKSGKSVAMRMLLERHPGISYRLYDMGAVWNGTSQMADSAADRTADRTPDKTVDRTPDKTADRTSERIADGKGNSAAFWRGEASGWTIVENLPAELPEKIEGSLEQFLVNVSGDERVILLSREKPPEPLLRFLWEGKMEIVPPETLLFTREEVRELARAEECFYWADAVYEESGGWPGCVSVLFRLLKGRRRYEAGRAAVRELCASYEVAGYVRGEILDTLNEEEKPIMWRAMACPWLSGRLCREVWGITDAKEPLESLRRKGLLHYDREGQTYSAAPLFRNAGESLAESSMTEGGADGRNSLWAALASWYECNGYAMEALRCLKKSGSRPELAACVSRHAAEIPYEVLCRYSECSWTGADTRCVTEDAAHESCPEECLQSDDPSPGNLYLKGICAYIRGDFQGLRRQMALAKEVAEKTEQGDSGNQEKKDTKEGVQENAKTAMYEVWLNLAYADPAISLEEWMELLRQAPGDRGQKYHLYHILGNSFTFLCGLRDLSGLFACTKKEEQRLAGIWRERLGEWEWLCYRMARLDYYIETARADSLLPEDQQLLESSRGCVNGLETNREIQRNPEHSLAFGNHRQEYRLAKLYLLCQYQRCRTGKSRSAGGPEPEKTADKLAQTGQREPAGVTGGLFHSLSESGSDHYRKTAEAIRAAFAPELISPDELAWWVHADENTYLDEISEENYLLTECRIKCLLHLNQNSCIRRNIAPVQEYLKKYGRTRFQTEACFQQALSDWRDQRRSEALKDVISAFLLTETSRYVEPFVFYGRDGLELLEAYDSWMAQNAPGGWHRKRPYNYGNVVRMPKEDYVAVVIRLARKTVRAENEPNASEDETFPNPEKLTMMETLVLQSIANGGDNASIARELGIKVNTVKTHTYNLYRKLGVNNRVQAVRKGRKMGMIQ